MKKLFKNKKGFTLMEMLIVVAIIVILVAVSMPVFSKQLTKAKDATNQANLRAAKAVATAEYLTEGKVPDTYAYDAKNGRLVSTSTSIEAYGKGDLEGKYIEVEIKDDGTVDCRWK